MLNIILLAWGEGPMTPMGLRSDMNSKSYKPYHIEELGLDYPFIESFRWW